MSTTASGFVDGSSCKTGVTPSNNNAPNIAGTTYTTAASGDLILTCVYTEGPLGQIAYFECYYVDYVAYWFRRTERRFLLWPCLRLRNAGGSRVVHADFHNRAGHA